MQAKLPSLGDAINVAVFGASGGIGAEIVRQLVADPAVARVLACSRSPVDLPDAKITSARFDITDDASIAAAAEAAGGPLDLVFVSTGILHDGERIRPEKSLRDLEAASMARVLEINTIGPALIAKHFLPLLRRGKKSVFAALSARVGSIGDNRLGGWTSYRMSKAALNMVLRTLAIEQSRISRESVVVGLHPGTVATDLSAPFTSRVPKEKLFTPARAARQLLEVIENLTPADTGNLFAWDGSRIEF